MVKSRNSGMAKWLNGKLVKSLNGGMGDWLNPGKTLVSNLE